PSSSPRAAAGARPQASDEFAVPLCRPQHRAVHRVGDERARWQTAGVDALKAARKLWKHTRVNEGRIRLEPTIRAVDADILGPWTARRPSKVVLIIDTPRWPAISHDRWC